MTPDDVKFSKIDDAIQRLATVAGDMSRMLAVHDQQINYHEKTIDNLIAGLEKRRDEVDERFKDMHDDLRAELQVSRNNSKLQHDEQNVKIEALQKYMWMAVGVTSAATWVIPIIVNKFLP